MSATPRTARSGRFPRDYVALLLALVLLLLAARGVDGKASQATPAATPVPPAVEILSRASARIAETETVHFTLEIEGETYIDDGNTIQLLEAEGDLVRPDRVSTEFKIKVAVATLTIRLVKIGNQTWSTNPVTGSWGEAPPEFSYSPGILFDTEEGIGPVMGKVRDPQLLEDEEIDDREAHHVAGIVDQEVIDPITGHTMDGFPVAVDLWIDRETDELLQVRLAEAKTDEDDDDAATWTLVLSDHGEQVTIEPPV